MKHESDFDISNTFLVEYTSTTFDSQKDTDNESYSAFTHEQTCRPKFNQEPAVSDITLEEDGSLTVEFSLEFNTTGFANCVDLTATVEIYNVDTDDLVYTSSMDSTEAATY